MSQPRLTLEQVRSRATEKVFARGEAYYWDDVIFDTVKRGSVIEAFCEASSQPEPYHVTATLGENGVAEATCTCPYDYGGACKHVVALLLTYVRRAQVFEERPAIEAALNARSKDELITLIQKMLTYYPDLKAVVDGRPHISEQMREDEDDYDDYDD
jgi:uncharacterized Zn finger protein